MRLYIYVYAYRFRFEKCYVRASLLNLVMRILEILCVISVFVYAFLQGFDYAYAHTLKKKLHGFFLSLLRGQN